MAAANTLIETFADHPATEVATGNPTGARRQRMKRSSLGIVVFAATLAGGLSAQGTALAAPINRPGAELSPASFQPYLFGGRQYCWYDSAWRGPGWYRCGYAWNNGFGWGGPVGWNGWRGGFGPIGYNPGAAHFGGGGRMGGFGDGGGGGFGRGGPVGGGFGNGGGHAFGGGGDHGGGGFGHGGGGGGGHGGGGRH